MTVRKLRKNQRGPICSFCESKAKYRGCLFKKFACAQHLDDLQDEDTQRSLPDHSEAQFQIRY